MQKLEFYVGTVNQSGLIQNLCEIDDLLEHQFGAFTRTMGRGRYEGQSEPVAVYTIFLFDQLVTPALVKGIASEIARKMDQQQVLWVIDSVPLCGLTGPGDDWVY